MGMGTGRNGNVKSHSRTSLLDCKYSTGIHTARAGECNRNTLLLSAACNLQNAYEQCKQSASANYFFFVKNTLL